MGTEVSEGSQKCGACTHSLHQRFQQMQNLHKISRKPRADMKAKISAQEGSRVETRETHSQVKE